MPAFYSRTGLSRLRRRRDTRLHGLSSTEFESAYLRERSRAYRTHQALSIVTFGLHPRSSRDLAVASRIACEDVRCSDVVGRLDRRTVAVLLPDTDGGQAWVFADRLRRKLAIADLSADPEVLTLGPPSSGSGERRGDASSDRVNGSAPRNGEEHPHHRNGLDAKERRGLEPLDPWPDHEAQEEQDDDERVASAQEALPVANATQRPVGDLWLETCKPLSPWRRALDVAVSGTALVALSPLLALVALAVKLTSPGPVFFVQKRAGVGGQPFSFIKFRSMYVDAEERKAALQAQNEKDGPIFKIKNDPRLTPLGRFIRKASIDELPQLYNVLVGDMTLIGPRPPTMNEVAAYEPWQRDRLSVPGGLTCIWQVSGRSDVGFDDWVRMDLRYAQTRNPMLDLSVVSRTFKAVATGRGAY